MVRRIFGAASEQKREISMASLTNKTRKIRNRKKARAGSQRKAQLRINGTTPKFAVHKTETTSSKS